MQPATPSITAIDKFEAEASSPTMWREVISQSILRLHFEAIGDEGFSGAVRANAEGGVHFAEIHATAHLVRRRPADIKDGRGAYVLCQLRAGRAEFTQNGRTALLSPGEFVVYDSTLPLEIIGRERNSSRFIAFPREMAGIAPAQMLDLTSRAIKSDSFLAPALSSTLTEAASVLGNLRPQSRLRALVGIVGLATALFLDELGGAPVEEGSGRLTFAELAQFIDRNLADPDLGPRSLAAAHFVSIRLIHRIFASEGATVGGWVRARRLERCREDLVLAEFGRTSVAAIADRWGIRSPSHFNQIFLQAYGELPSQYRKRVLRQ
ncbi:AraC-like DNA-binding protein [Arthrobacter sp. SLBN-100]|uniref:helix-turn-helix domain-containing protein n=1 Tax=Arthrobacter sp. SLBN-100 TaxID=2768450 RepID=UPI00117241DC|nr:helix-turn-helix domain-containing protein [Arthrobacter sp. SLBN-100]TQJ62073.1 AraC-like DNA-binding protein [Arthrobacter sp. SLBN-100]